MYKKHTKEEWAKVLELYKEGAGPAFCSRATGINERDIRHRCRQYDLTGVWYTERKKNVRPDAALKLSAVLAVTENSLSLDEVTVKYGISRGCLRSWLCKYGRRGEEGLLATKPRGRPPKMPKSKRTKGTDELERLGEENEYLKAENAYLKN